MLGFGEIGKPEYPGKNFSEQPNKLKPRRVKNFNPTHIGWRLVFSPLRHPCSLIFKDKGVLRPEWLNFGPEKWDFRETGSSIWKPSNLSRTKPLMYAETLPQEVYCFSLAHF